MQNSTCSQSNFSELLLSAQNFNQTARDEMGEMYFPLLNKLAHKFKYQLFLGEDDAVGEACVAFTEALDSFNGGGQKEFENYIAKAVFNRFNRKMRANLEKCKAECSVEWETDSLGNSYGLDHSMDYYLKELHSILTDRQFKIVLLRLDEMSDAEIAKQLGICRRSVNYELIQIRKVVRDKLFCR